MIYIGCTKQSKEFLEKILKELDFEIEVIENDNIYDLTVSIVHKVLENKDENKGIIIDNYGTIPFMIASKHKYIICAQLNDEHSAKMTRDHNNSNVITLGYNVIGKDVAVNIIKRFVNGKYAGGRHQVRIDMLDKMG